MITAMEKLIDIPKDKYVVAVSGGIDSMVLLDLVRRCSEQSEVLVGHYMHGVRLAEEGARDLRVITEYCDKHNIRVQVKRYSGSSQSEAELRRARYEFLENLRETEDYNYILTAHHNDDVIETAIINLLRGTNSAGLVSLGEREKIKRPLLDWSKTDILVYAKTNRVQWHEDSTNTNTKYLRNYVRQEIVPKLEASGKLAKFAEAISAHRPVEEEANIILGEVISRISEITPTAVKIQKTKLIQLPHAVSLKVLRVILADARLQVEVDTNLLTKAVVFAKTARAGSKMDLSKHAVMSVESQTIELGPRG